MEVYVGEPYAYTIDIRDEFLLRATLSKIKNMEVKGIIKMPKYLVEFSIKLNLKFEFCKTLIL